MIYPGVLSLTPVFRIRQRGQDIAFQTFDRGSSVGNILPLVDLEVEAVFVDRLSGIQLLLVLGIIQEAPKIRGPKDGGSSLEGGDEGTNIVQVSFDNFDSFLGPVLGLVRVPGHPTDLPARLLEEDIGNGTSLE